MVLESVLFYSIIIVMSALFAEYSSKENKNRNIILFFATFVPAITAGLRYNTGTDYTNYQVLYNEIATYGHSFTTPNLEIGFVLLNRACKHFGLGYQGLLFIVAFITYYFALKAIRVYREYLSVGLAYFIYLIAYFQPSFNLIRQAAALSIAFYAITILEKGKRLRCIAYIVAATLLHNSAIVIMLPIGIYLLYTGEFPRWIKRVGILTICVAMVFYDWLFMIAVQAIPFLVRYTGYILKGELRDFGFTIFIRYGFMLVPFLGVYQKYKKEKLPVYPFFILLMGFVFRLSTYASQTDFAFRITFYFQIFQVLCIPLLVRYFNKYRYIKGDRLRIISKSIVSVAIVFWIYDAFVLLANETVPYHSIFGG